MTVYRKPGRDSLTRPGETLRDELAEYCKVLLDAGLSLSVSTRAFQKAYMIELLTRFGGNQCKAARDQGMHRNTLSRLLNELQIDARQFRTKRGHRHDTEPGRSSISE